MFGFGLSGMLIAAFVSLVTGFSGGFYTASRFDKVAALELAVNVEKSKVLTLQENIRIMQVSLAEDAARATQDADKMAELERISDDLKTQVSSGMCLTGDDVKRLRNWWGTRSIPTPKPRKRAR